MSISSKQNRDSIHLLSSLHSCTETVRNQRDIQAKILTAQTTLRKISLLAEHDRQRLVLEKSNFDVHQILGAYGCLNVKVLPEIEPVSGASGPTRFVGVVDDINYEAAVIQLRTPDGFIALSYAETDQSAYDTADQPKTLVQLELLN